MCSNSFFSAQILKRDENSQVKPPRVIQEEIQKSSPKGSRPFSTAARSRQESLMQHGRVDSERLEEFQGVENKDLAQTGSVGHENEGLMQLKSVFNGSMSNSKKSTAVDNPGHIFDLPQLPLPENDRLKHRYDPLILQMTNLLMRDGKKGLAQRV